MAAATTIAVSFSKSNKSKAATVK
jgi:hypothetical protein